MGEVRGRFGINRGALIGAVASLLVACGGSTSAPQPATSSTPFNVLAVAGLSGPNGATGTASVNGMQAAALVINREGGILGHKVVIKSYDTGSNPTQAVTLVTQAVNSGTTWNFTYSGNTSDEQVAEGATVKRAKIIGIANNGLLALGDPNTYPYHFVNGSNADVVAKFLVENAQKQNFKKLALLTEDNSFGQQEHNSIGSALKAAGMQYIDSVFSATAVDTSPALLQLQAQGVDGVIFNSLGASTGYVLKSRLKVGFMVPFIGDLGVSSGDVLGLAGGAEGIKNVTMQNWAMNIYDP